MGLGFLGRKAS